MNYFNKENLLIVMYVSKLFKKSYRPCGENMHSALLEFSSLNK